MNKQSEILEYINRKLTSEGYSPSVREIAKAVNLKSTSSVQYHLDNLIKKGLLTKKANLSRSLSNNQKTNTFMSVPVIGEISAGTPLLAEENKIGEIPIVEEKYNKVPHTNHCRGCCCTRQCAPPCCSPPSHSSCSCCSRR